MSQLNDAVVSAARNWIGTPYRHQSATRDVGCDCLGLIIGVWCEIFGERKFTLPPYSSNWRDKTHADDLLKLADKHLVQSEQSALEPGQIILLRLHNGLPAKHCAIISGTNHFIHAQERVGVVEVPLSKWWRRRVFAQFDFPQRA